jgi:DNA-binding NarL/FixJ family response regulator
VQGDLASLFTGHVQALLATDGPALDAVAASFEDMGANLLAAEAATAAAGAHRRVDHARSAACSAVRAAELAAACEGGRTPTLTRLDEPAGLTPRELEIARMAACGLSSRAIAARLVVAVRTVDNALGQVYAKLCIGGRNELARIFTVSGRTHAMSSHAVPAAHGVSHIG